MLLRRYGVVFRRLLTRERAAPPWRSLVRALRRLEARGEVRGGRFVHGGLVSGEQYALPEAVGLLRRVRRDLRDEDDKAGARAALISVCAADPINLLGIITPGSRLPATLGNRLLLRAGVPVAVLEGGEVRHLDASTPEQAWAASNALLRRGDVSARVAH